jgi:hypothetical protein
VHSFYHAVLHIVLFPALGMLILYGLFIIIIIIIITITITIFDATTSLKSEYG